MFHVGQKVVCVDDKNWRARFFMEKLPIQGEVYTIRGFFEALDGLRIWLEEIKNEKHHYADHGFMESPFLLRRFRPVHKTDISIFTAMLNPITKKENA